MTQLRPLLKLDDYRPLIGDEAIHRIREKGDRVKKHHVVHVNSTHYGGGVAEMLLSITLLMNDLGIMTGWRVIRGIPDFFTITKKMHNALQGGPFHMTKHKKQIYEQVVFENAARTHLHAHDYVVIHDPQPLPMIEHYTRKGTWIWRCHLDLSNPHKELWNYLRDFINKYDAAIFTIPEYSQKLHIPEFFFLPAIDPFSLKNSDLTEEEMQDRLKHYNIPTDLPIVVQVSRFDRWKDPAGVIEACRIARKKADFTLVLLGNAAADDPEGTEVYEELTEKKDERTLVIPHGDDTALVNTLQRKAHVVIQKSTREGFGLTVTEAMWKGTPVIGGRVGGIPRQIDDGVNGFLVSSVEECADKIVTILGDDELRKSMGAKAREKVKENFLLTRLLEEYLDLFIKYSKD